MAGSDCDQSHRWNYHHYIGNRADHEYRTEVPPLPGSDGLLLLYVSKVGGGRLGERYEGAWYYQVIGCGLSGHGDDLYTGMPHTHAEAAGVLVHILASRLALRPSADVLAERLAAFTEGLL